LNQQQKRWSFFMGSRIRAKYAGMMARGPSSPTDFEKNLSCAFCRWEKESATAGRGLANIFFRQYGTEIKAH
jgi:hypothetical protein